MSWKQKALQECYDQDISFQDQSTATEYVGTLTTVYSDEIILFAGEREHTVRMRRHKGSDKSKFWCTIYDTVMGGTIYHADWHNHISLGATACTCGYPLADIPEE